ncbi:hypothetical protein CAC42_6285 [Sphaceloma murrayae]|uniref:Nucleotide-diphospho-sugar transferase domain-containing protein n=1 Tax=Sphaceloma murrayae TaxID=2082308 RepID=A0A2K1QTS2_9PEZI|nr:hypothetical protein CAC42_6285 [Sphaceloma murrayae]
MSGRYHRLDHIAWQEKQKKRTHASSRSCLADLEQKTNHLWQTTSFLVKLTFFMPLLISALVGPAWLIVRNYATPSVPSELSAGQMLNQMPWNPSLMPHYDVLKPLRNGHFGSKLYPNKLGKKVLLLDVDDRTWMKEDPANMTDLAYGRLNHYLYAQMHGYDYKFIQVPRPPQDTFRTWAKIPGIYQALKLDYQFIVFTDYDVIFPHLKIPLEWFLDHWNVTSEIILTSGSAPNLGTKGRKAKMRLDSFHHKLSINSGFMIVQKTPKAHDFFKDWMECTSEVKFKGCATWKNEPLHEQRAYADYIRYEYPGTTREVPCDEVNGNNFRNEGKPARCRGTLVQHMYNDAKSQVRDAVQVAVANVVLPEVIKAMQEGIVNEVDEGAVMG